eukprot:CFRG5161T1
MSSSSPRRPIASDETEPLLSPSPRQAMRDYDESGLLLSTNPRPATSNSLKVQQEIDKKRLSAQLDEQRCRSSDPAVLDADETDEKEKNKRAFLISFLLMVVFGLGNKIFNKLETIPMHNYPFFISIYTCFVYIPLSFAYIIPMIKYGSAITPEERLIPHKTFFVMGFLDSISSTMMVFATNFLDGSLVIMLQQMAIPVSMVLSYFLMSARYNKFHILGAGVVVIGLMIVLLPQLFGSGAQMSIAQLGWVAVMVLACVPMTLSSVYKEEVLGDQQLDPIYLNGWVAVWQFIVGIPLAIPAAYTVPGGNIAKIPDMIYGGLKCYMGINTVMVATEGVTVDDCGIAPFYVNIYLIFNLGYNVLMILILKYGNANLLWLAMALMVPMGSAAFSMPFMPGYKPLGVNGTVGLLVIVFGLAMYRFSNIFSSLWDHLLGRSKLPIMGGKLKPRGINHLLHQRGDQMDVTQFIWEGYSYSVEHQLRDLKKDVESLRSGYLGRLGIRSPSMSSPVPTDIGNESRSLLSSGTSYVTHNL